MRANSSGKWLVLFGWLGLSLIMSGASFQAQAEPSGPRTFRPPHGLEAPYVPGEVLVKFKESPATFRGKSVRRQLRSVSGAAAAEFAAALPTKARASLERVQGQVVRAHPNIGVLRVKIPPHVSVRQAIDALHRSGTVEYAEPNGVIKMQGTPADPLFSSQWGLHNGGGGGTPGADIKAPEAWDIVYPGDIIPPDFSKAIVAVVDTGVDYLHEDMLGNMWFNTAETPGDGIDNDDNHFLDDYYGIDTTMIPSSGNPMDPPPNNGGHGTAIAGIIGAAGNNNKGMTGVNWQTRIMALRCGNGGGGTVSAAITCINYALAKRGTMPDGITPTPLIITLAWKQASNSYDNSLHDALRIAQDQGALVVAAAGNDGEDNDIIPNYPSGYNHNVNDFKNPLLPNNPIPTDTVTLDNIISVGGSDQFDKRETNSSYGLATVDLFAPGKNIVFPVTSTSAPHTSYSSGTGTSFATAYVAGACALLWNKYPDKDWKQIKALIMNGADDGMAQDFHAICVTEGRLNLVNSLDPAIVKAPAVFSIFEVPPAIVTGDPTIVPGRADTGDTLVITGVNFGPSETPGTLSFLDATFPAANILSWSPEKIVATVPAGLPKGTGRLKVTNALGRTSRGACFSNLSREKLVGNLLQARGLAAGAQVGRDVWIMGGRTYWGIIPHVEKYSLDTNHAEIDSLWAMPAPVSNAGAASIGSKIYVVGGATEDTAGNVIPVTNLQIFDTVTRSWEAGPPLPKALMQCAVTSIGTRLYVFGGLVKSPSNFSYSAVTDAFSYDTATNAWNSIKVLPTAASYAAAATTASGKIWVMGGFTNSGWNSQQSLVQEYDPGTDQWTPQLHLVRTRGGAAGLNFAGKVYCLRGTKPYQSSNFDEYADGEWYNPLMGYWMPSIMNYLGIYPTPTPSGLNRMGLYSAAPGKYRDKIYLLGGVLGAAGSPYKFDYSNKVWAFPAPGGGLEGVAKGLPFLQLLLDD